MIMRFKCLQPVANFLRRGRPALSAAEKTSRRTFHALSVSNREKSSEASCLDCYKKQTKLCNRPELTSLPSNGIAQYFGHKTKTTPPSPRYTRTPACELNRTSNKQLLPLPTPLSCCSHRQYSNGPKDHIMSVFDRKTKRAQRNRTAEMDDYEVYDYIKEEMGYRMYDRICDIKRKFDVAVDLGCGRGHVSKHILEETVGSLYMCDHAEKVLAQAETSPEVPTTKLHVDEEFLPFKNSSLDLVFSSLCLHWVNDLPGTFKQVNNALKPDGAFIGSMFGGETLFELRVALQLAELEREGGFAPHVSPFTDTRDIGGLLNRTGFTLLTIDVDELIVNYPSIFELMADLKGMGENNCSWNRKVHLHRDTAIAAAAIYKDMYGNPDGTVPATFHVLHFIGWKPDPSQAKPAKRGSGQISIKDLGRLDEIMKEHGEEDGDTKEK